jgi:hypothetical protein
VQAGEAGRRGGQAHAQAVEPGLLAAARQLNCRCLPAFCARRYAASTASLSALYWGQDTQISAEDAILPQGFGQVSCCCCCCCC